MGRRYPAGADPYVDDLIEVCVEAIEQIVTTIVTSIKSTPGTSLERVAIGERRKLALKIDVFTEQFFEQILHTADNGKFKNVVVHGEERLAKEELDLRGKDQTFALLDAVDGTDLVERELSNWCSTVVLFEPKRDPGQRILLSCAGLPSGEIYCATSAGTYVSREAGKAFERVRGPSGVKLLEDASISFYGQTPKTFQTIYERFVGHLPPWKVKEGGTTTGTRLYNLDGIPMAAKLVDQLTPGARWIDAVIGLDGQKAHDFVPGAYLAKAAGATILDLRGRHLEYADLEELLMMPARYRATYVMAATESLGSALVSLIRGSRVISNNAASTEHSSTLDVSTTPADLGASIAAELPHLVRTKKGDRYINYDQGFLLNEYRDEQSVAAGLAYTEVFSLYQLGSSESINQSITIDVSDQKLDRYQGSTSWRSTSDAGFEAQLHDKRVRVERDETLVRVYDARVYGAHLRLSVERAVYHDQAHSNLMLDFDLSNQSAYTPLRKQLCEVYGNRLPPLADRRLANTLGVAVVLFFQNKLGQWAPYLVQRVEKEIAVFPGGVHCTASGAAKWPKKVGDASLHTYATQHLLDEIEEEVGLSPDQVHDLSPVALCREMARGGKPQLFYAGFTPLGIDQIKEAFANAKRQITATKGTREIKRPMLDIALDAGSLRTRLAKDGLTLEGAGALWYGLKYLESRQYPVTLPQMS